MIDASEDKRSEHFGLSQTDFYQMFAYGHKYLGGKGELYLVYPAHEQFEHMLGPFNFSSELNLWIVPFDLHSREIRATTSTLPLKAIDARPPPFHNAAYVADGSMA